MKKLGKKLSFLTKVMLVIGLLISNLSSLSVVFADEISIDISVVDGELNIKYLGELTDEVKKVRIDVYENYTFLDGSNLENEVSEEVSFVIPTTSDEEVENTDNVADENLEVQNVELVEGENELDVVTDDVETDVEVYEDTDEIELVVATESDEILTDGMDTEVNVEEDTENTDEVSKKIDLVIEESVLASNVFDGRYNVEVEIVDITDEENEKVIATRDYGMDVIHDSGIEYRLFDSVSNEELSLEDGKYLVSYTSPKVRVEGRLLAGGLSPKDMLMYNDGDYYAEDLVKEVFIKEIDFNGRLYGDYTVPVAVEIEKYNRDTSEYELIEISEEDINVLYGSYDLNTLAMNFATEELTLSEIYEFVGDAKDGVVYVLLDENRTNTMLDLYNIANYMFVDDEIVTFDLSNGEYENVISTFDESVATMSLTDMLANIELDQTTVLSLINDGLTVTYKVVFAGDVNSDNVLSNEDLVEIIDQVLGNKDADLEKSDFYDKNDEVNILDTIYLDQVLKTGDYNTSIIEENVQIESELTVLEEEIVSGGKFTVELMVKLSDYAINGLGGLFTYDDTKLQLESIESVNEWIGNNNEGNFLYVGEESLELPVVEDEIEDNDDSLEEEIVIEEDNQEIEEIVVTEDYVVISAVFTALKSGVHTVGVKNLEYFNQNVYYGVNEDEILVEVTVSSSDNNNLSTLIVAGQTIELVAGQLEYEITVGNDVTVADVEAVLENVSANITSIVSPEELVEGENIITITVVAENGDEKIYTVKVIREASEKEENTQSNYNNYQDYNNNTDEDDEVVATPDDTDEEDDDEDDKKQEESELSRIVIIILILLVIAGLIYLIFKDEDDEDTVRVNKDINKLKKEVKESEVKKEVKTDVKVEKKSNNSKSSNNNKNGNNRNNKKGR